MRLTTSLICLFIAFISAAAGAEAKLPLSFELNGGQTDPRVQFLARVAGYTLFVTSTEAVFAGRDGRVETMRWTGASSHPSIQPLDPLPGVSNYFIGNNPAKWRTNIRTYSRVALRDVYPGIDLIFHGSEQHIEYDWMVAPGADPARIRVRWEGIDKINRNSNGDLSLTAALVQQKPLARQGDTQIESRYVVHGREVAFDLSSYDRSRPLVIDPVIVYSTFLGGNGTDHGQAVALDSSGNVYTAGHTTSTNFPTAVPLQPNRASTDNSQDAFVAKVNAAGTALVYSTYLGGSSGDEAFGIAVDPSGNAYLSGYTQSSDFPVLTPLQAKLNSNENAFVAKLNAAGSALIYSTYLGGAGTSVGTGIAADSSGNAYITGYTAGQNFPSFKPLQPDSPLPSAFISKLNPSGSAFIYSTIFGGNANTQANAIAIDSSGNAYITGVTQATNLPTVNAVQPKILADANAFVSKIASDGSALLYSTYLGGNGKQRKDEGNGIAVDASGSAYVTGFTGSTNFPTVNAAQPNLTGPQDAFITKFNPAGSAIVYSTYLGGTQQNQGNAIAVNAAGEAYVTGWTESPDFPIVNAIQSKYISLSEMVFVTKLSADGSTLLYSTFLGGNSPSFGNAIAVDGSGNAFLTGYAGRGATPFPTVNAIQGSIAGSVNAFLTEISTGPALPGISSVVNGASFQSGIVPGSWATIKGGNLSSVIDTWANFIVNGQLPTLVDGVGVAVGGQPAYVYYISGGQINFIVPNVATGSEPVVVTNSVGSSAAVSATVNAFGPAFFAWPNNQVVATRQDFSYAVKNGTFPGTTTIPAKPGDVIILWATGFGPTTPAAQAAIETPSDTTYNTSTLPTVTINNVNATVFGAALAPGFAGLYQIAIQVPTSLANGDWPVVATIGGVSSPAGLVLSVQQ